MQANTSVAESSWQLYGQVIVGPPGSGKSTYCTGMKSMLEQLGRNVAIINLDPANEDPPYDSAMDIRELAGLAEVMDAAGLGPNGALVYCMELLETNFRWLQQGIASIAAEQNGDVYFLIDLPGQVELYTHCTSVSSLLRKLGKAFDFRLVAVHLVESTHCASADGLVSSLLVSLSAMLRLELPHVNLLSKFDLADPNGTLAFAFENGEDGLEATYLLSLLGGDDRNANQYENNNSNHNNQDSQVEQPMQTTMQKKHARLQAALGSMLEDYSLLSLVPLSIDDKTSVGRVVMLTDKCIGYINSADAVPTQ